MIERSASMFLSVALVMLVACSSGEIKPAEADQSTLCAGCRMTVSDLRFAGQLVARGEEPRFFDDIGCMRKYFAKHRAEAEWTPFVTDYRTKKWVDGKNAHYWKCEAIETPMSSHLVATESETPPADGCTAMTVTDITTDGLSGPGGRGGQAGVHTVHKVHPVHDVHPETD